MPGEKLKRASGFIMTYLAGIVLCVGFIILHSCDYVKGTVDDRSQDSVQIAKSIEAIVNPSVTSVKEVMLLQSTLNEEYSIDELFRNMPEEVLNNVASVCLKKKIAVTKKDIVNEYIKGRAVYDNLPSQSTTPPNNKQNTSTTATEEQQKPVGMVSIRFETDTINGKPVKVQIREERTYE